MAEKALRVPKSSLAHGFQASRPPPRDSEFYEPSHIPVHERTIQQWQERWKEAQKSAVNALSSQSPHNGENATQEMVDAVDEEEIAQLFDDEAISATRLLKITQFRNRLSQEAKKRSVSEVDEDWIPHAHIERPTQPFRLGSTMWNFLVSDLSSNSSREVLLQSASLTAAPFGHVTELNLDSNRISDGSLNQIVKDVLLSANGCRSLRVLDLSRNQLNDSAVAALLLLPVMLNQAEYEATHGPISALSKGESSAAASETAKQRRNRKRRERDKRKRVQKRQQSGSGARQQQQQLRKRGGLDDDEDDDDDVDSTDESASSSSGAAGAGQSSSVNFIEKPVDTGTAYSGSLRVLRLRRNRISGDALRGGCDLLMKWFIPADIDIDDPQADVLENMAAPWWRNRTTLLACLSELDLGGNPLRSGGVDAILDLLRLHQPAHLPLSRLAVAPLAQVLRVASNAHERAVRHTKSGVDDAAAKQHYEFAAGAAGKAMRQLATAAVSLETLDLSNTHIDGDAACVATLLLAAPRLRDLRLRGNGEMGDGGCIGIGMQIHAAVCGGSIQQHVGNDQADESMLYGPLRALDVSKIGSDVLYTLLAVQPTPSVPSTQVNPDDDRHLPYWSRAPFLLDLCENEIGGFLNDTRPLSPLFDLNRPIDLVLDSTDLQLVEVQALGVELGRGAPLVGLSLARNELSHTELGFLLDGLVRHPKWYNPDIKPRNGQNQGPNYGYEVEHEREGPYFRGGCRLRKLSLASNGLTDRDAEDIAINLTDNRSLTELNLMNNPLGASGVEQIGVAVAKRSSRLSRRRHEALAEGDRVVELSAESAAGLEGALASVPHDDDEIYCTASLSRVSREELATPLRALDAVHAAGDFSIGGSILGARPVSRSDLHQLHTLNLWGCSGGAGCAGVVASLDAAPALRTLNLGSNMILDSDMDRIAHNLSYNSTLETLNLSWNGFSEKGLAEVLSALVTTQIRYLDISSNRLEPRGGILVAQALAHRNCPLHVLIMAHNPIKDRGAIAIAQALGALGNGSVLRLLDFTECGLFGDYDCAMELANMLEACPNLIKLSLLSNPLQGAKWTPLLEEWRVRGRDTAVELTVSSRSRMY